MATIASVQTGTLTLPSATASDTVTITSVDPAKSILFVTYRGATDPNEARDAWVRGELTNGTTLTFTRGGTTGSVDIRWTVVEYSVGVSVQRGTDNLTAETTNKTITSVDTAKTFVLLSASYTGASYFNARPFARAELTTATNLALTVDDATNSLLTVAWQVVEFTDTTSVQSGTVNLGAAATSVTDAITSVDTGKAFLVFSYEGVAVSGSDGVDNANIRGRITSPTQLTFDRNLAEDEFRITWFVVELETGAVQNVALSQADTVGTSNNAISEVDTANSVAFAAGLYHCMGKGSTTTDEADNGCWTHEFTTTTNLQSVRADTDGSADGEIYVIDFAAAGGGNGEPDDSFILRRRFIHL